MRQNTLSIHSENILPIIKKWLYSSHDIFLRELVSNACDAIKKLRTLRDCQEAESDDEPFAIHIRIDAAKGIISIEDNGIGMTDEEVEKYIAQIAFSGAEEFVAKYKSQSEKDPMIGHFGLGFYSSYMVASQVEIETLSYRKEASAVHWSCDGSSSYSIGQGKRKTRGTEVILHIDKERAEYLDTTKIRSLLDRYCAFMPEAIFLNGQSIENQAPLWMKSPSVCSDNDYISFYRKLYPLEPDPIFWIHLNIDYPFCLQGILYFPKVQRHLDQDSASIRLFCNRVFVTEQCREFLPDYLTLLRGAIDSTDIPLNVSRSYLQVDQNVHQLGTHISKKVSDRLNALFKTERDKYISFWPEIEALLKLGLLQDEKFYERSQDAVIWKNNLGKWTNLTEYLDRSKEKKVYYCEEDRSQSLQKIYQEKGVEILFTNSPIDVALISKFESERKDVTFHRLDSQLDPMLIDKSKENGLLDADGKTLSGRLVNLFEGHLKESNLTIDAQSLSTTTVPGLLLIDENMRRMRDYFQLTQGKKWEAPLKKTFVINTNHPLVNLALRLSEQKPEIAKNLIYQIYHLSLLSQKELDSNHIPDLVTQNEALLQQLAELSIK